MPVEESEILQTAQKLGDLVSQHPAVAKYKAAQKAVADDPEASRLFSEFNRQLEMLLRQEQSGMPVTDAQRGTLEQLQSRIVSHIKIKAMNLAEVDFMDLMRKVSQTWQKPLAEAAGSASAAAAGARMAR
jgi:cell fate (sporulation/competence/biofilm development) regulator YlbF (YheA/YmcA/DUF963 family)